VNQFYQPITNFEIETNSRTQSCLCCNVLIPETKTVIQTEFEDLIKILDANNDHDALKIIKPMIAAIFYQQEIIIAEVNLQTENGESPLSIASKYGFSNVVKFLISKGAEKEHFTNEHHTPLSLAVSQNHLKVVQVLFENWISPNSHEKPYLHMLPIFNVKSREIAQLLIDNDAVTHEIYNDKNQSPLTVACQNGYRDVVEFFLDDGLEINHLDSDNKTPFFYAITNNHNDIANLLISKGAQTYY
jgi:ankyrin repeat protein